ncbi:uncharacterized protein [Rutidosis leptorrhynchoides]|uniref:uncharacterized protein n=1 Tax=Rutidosis leptorrhynchoides TaxID=125765 RepID=UPI003A99E320
MDQVTRCQALKMTTDVKTQGNKRKWDKNQGNSSQQKKHDNPKSENTSANKNYNGKKPYYNRCYKHHYGACTIVCDRCKKAKGAREDPELVTGTFLLNNCIAYVLFDSGADRNFISKDFSIVINVPPTALDTKYVIELADGKILKVDKIFRGCVLTLADTLFEVDLMPIELGSFDVIIGMDWLSKNHVDIACVEKAIRIPLANGETLVVQGDKSGTKLNIISCMKAHKCLRKGCQAILAYVKEIESEEKRFEDVPVVKDFPGVFPEDLPGLRSRREVEF